MHFAYRLTWEQIMETVRMRRAIQAVCEGRDLGDLTTIEDPAALEQIRALVAASR